MQTSRTDGVNNRLLAGLPPEDLGRLRPHLQPVTWPLRQTLYEVGQVLDNVYFIEEGIASIVTIMADGATSEVGMIGIEGVVGVSALLGSRLSAQHVIVQLPGTALRLNAALCKAAFDERPALHSAVLRFIDAFLNLSAQTAACNRLHSARQRFARWLLMARDRTCVEAMPMTHEFLSSMLGLRRAGVTMIARELQRSGLIQYRHGQIAISNPGGLEAMACECYRLDHERLRRLVAG